MNTAYTYNDMNWDDTRTTIEDSRYAINTSYTLVCDSTITELGYAYGHTWVEAYDD